MSFEALRQILTQPPSNDIAQALKQWRADTNYSQAEAAIRLGVSLRTLQGWELGRPMPYPGLLQRAVPTLSRPMTRYVLSQTEFPREFAEFIDFVGATPLETETRKVERRLHSLTPNVRALYGDRYFFQEQCVSFTYDFPAFGLDVANPQAVRSAALIAGINRVKRSLSPKSTDRFRAITIDNFKLDRDMRQLEHEIRCWTHFAQKGFKVTFADIEDAGRFDLLVETPGGCVAVECKTISEDTGDQIKTELVVNLAEVFNRVAAKSLANAESGLIILTLKKPADSCKNLPYQLEVALRDGISEPFRGEDFSLTFSPRPCWQALVDAGAGQELERQIKLEADGDKSERCSMAFPKAGKVFGLAVRSDTPTQFRRRLVKILKGAADQCPSRRPSAVWLHFVGVAETDFRALCEFSLNGSGAGLNAVVAEVLHPDASPTDRSHVERIRFSSDGRALRHQPMLDTNLILIKTVSHGGSCYDVPNPRCRFVPIIEI